MFGRKKEEELDTMQVILNQDFTSCAPILGGADYVRAYFDKNASEYVKITGMKEVGFELKEVQLKFTENEFGVTSATCKHYFTAKLTNEVKYWKKYGAVPQ